MLEQRKGYGGTERCLGTGRNRSHYEEESHTMKKKVIWTVLEGSTGTNFSNQSEDTHDRPSI